MELTIRRMRHSDLAALCALLADRRVMAYIEPPYSTEQAERFLQAAGLSEPPLVFAVEERGVFVGYVIYHDYDENSMEIGWVLRPDCWNKGYATELTKQLIRNARAEEKSVVIECVPAQRATKHIAERFGFSKIGTRNGCDVFRLEIERREQLVGAARMHPQAEGRK